MIGKNTAKTPDIIAVKVKLDPSEEQFQKILAQLEKIAILDSNSLLLVVCPR